MAIQLIKKLADEIRQSDFCVAGIEMSPEFHLRLIYENQNLVEKSDDIQQCNIDRTVCDVPILFVGVDGEYYKLLNAEQYRQRVKLNDLLRIYGKKYANFKVFINHKDKIKNGELEQIKLLESMRDLVKRIDQSEIKIGLLSH